MGDYAKAEPLYQRALKIDEKALGPDHPDTATALNNLAELYRVHGRLRQGRTALSARLKIREKALGPDHPDTATSPQQSGASCIDSMGDYAKAEPLFQRALKIREKALGPDHPDTATGLNNLAELYRSMGDYAKAEPLFQRALKIREKALGPDHPDTATALNNLAAAVSIPWVITPKPNRSFSARSRSMRKPSAPITQTPPRPSTIWRQLYHSMGDYAKAEPLYQRALKIREKALGPDHPDTATALNNLARLYYSMGDYAKAEPLYQRALKIEEKALGPDHPDTATALNNLAELYRSMGDYAKAEPLYQRALKIKEKALGPDHPDTATALNNLAELYYSMGDYAKAEPLYQRALKITRKPSAPITQTPPRPSTIWRSCIILMGDYAKAEPLYQRALKIKEKALGPDHPDTAKALNNLAVLYHSMGDYAKAEPLFQRALKIDEKALGPDHPDTATALNNLALLKIDLGEAKDAIPLATRARQAEEKYLSNILSFTSEQQRLAFQKTTDPYTLFATLGSAAELAQTVLRQKGVVLDSLLEDRLVAEASADPKQREIIAQLRAAKQRLMQLVLEVPKDLSEAAQKQRAAEKEKLSTEVEQLEGGLARQVAGLGKARRALSVTVPQVQSVLPKQAVLIELLRYSHYLGKGKFETRYGAVVISASGEPKWVPLGAAAEIEKDVKLYQKSVRGETDEATLGNVLKALEERVWAPIEKALPTETTTVIMSPDGELSFVSFATLLTPDDRFLGEKYSIRYVASGRDLLSEQKRSASELMVAFGDPDFGSAPKLVAQQNLVESPTPTRALDLRGFENMLLSPLPGTAKECAALQAQAKAAGQAEPSVRWP